MAEDYFRVLSLDGGGAKGFYTIGVLRQIEALTGKRLCEVFDLIFGNSTGSIIAALLALGYSTEEIHELYKRHVVNIMKRLMPWNKSAALAELAQEVFQDRRFDAFKTDVGIVTTKWVEERPMIFKTDVKQAYSSQTSFVPGFGATISDAVQASCSAYPFFTRKNVTTTTNGTFLLADGGYCANNPTLYAQASPNAAACIVRWHIHIGPACPTAFPKRGLHDDRDAGLHRGQGLRHSLIVDFETGNPRLLKTCFRPPFEVGVLVPLSPLAQHVK